LAATAAIVVTVAVQMLVQLLPVAVCAALIVGIIRARSGRRGLPGASTPAVIPGYRYTQHQWGWTRTPQGRWAWVSVWIAQPAEAANVIDAEVISDGHDGD